jgi:hypothetical protein
VSEFLNSNNRQAYQSTHGQKSKEANPESESVKEPMAQPLLIAFARR